ncbi:MAG: hypothetical protein RLO04_12290 [Limnobacter sp.]|uniref:hypothetical protein n=1 Tax=Limnobacter sp. TaxID=2003368 RepID=UPI0032F047CC
MVTPVNSIPQFLDYTETVNYNDAKRHIQNENGVTNEVFVRYIQAEYGNVSRQDASALFDEIDANNSGGLRLAEFNKWAAGSKNTSGVSNSNINTAGVDASFGDYKKLTRVDGGVDTFKNVKSDYLVIVESHGRDAFNTVESNELLKVKGATLVGFGGSHDKYIALYKITDPTVTITGDGGSGQALFINTDQKVSLSAKPVDPALGGEKLKGPSKPNQLAIYADDEGGKGSVVNGVSERDQFFKSRAIGSFGAGDDLIHIIGNKLSANNSEGPTLNGAAGVLTFT